MDNHSGWVNVNIGGGKHNVVFVVTMRDSVYAFDADASPSVTYWQDSLIPSGETYGNRYDFGTNDIYPDIGILGTPVIDGAAGTIYWSRRQRPPVERTTSGCTL